MMDATASLALETESVSFCSCSTSGKAGLPGVFCGHSVTDILTWVSNFASFLDFNASTSMNSQFSEVRFSSVALAGCSSVAAWSS